MNLLITGGKGYIAQAIYQKFKDIYDITLIDRSMFDLTNSIDTTKWFESKQFDVIIHTAISGGNRLLHENTSMLDCNLKMYYNLLDSMSHYTKFINIGSGAELVSKGTPYGLSKHVIRTSILDKDNFYNLRVYGLFDENELDRRFIKSNITRYIERQDLLIHQDKKMDFFYMEDFLSVVNYYIDQTKLPKELDCTYDTSYYLSDIAKKINTLSEYSVNVHISDTSSTGTDYVGTYTDIGLSYVGLYNAIDNVYQKLLCKR